MKFDLVAPCKDCPFRSDRPGFLRPARAREITASLLHGDAPFSCHKHNTFGDDGEVTVGDGAQHCAGALIFLAKNGQPNFVPRLAVAAGLLDLSRLRMDAPVFDTAEEMIAAQR